MKIRSYYRGEKPFKYGILAVKEFNPDVVLLDDGFQHLKLVRDIDLVLLDNNKPFGNNHFFPRGILRETVSSLVRGDAVILTRSDIEKPEPLNQIESLIPGKPIFSSFHTPYIFKVVTGNSLESKDRLKISTRYEFEIFKDRRVLAFSGIARNDDFRRIIEGFKCELVEFSEFPDHHWYSNKELSEIVSSAKSRLAEYIFTTEKDYVRIIDKKKWPIDIVVIGIETIFRDETFDHFIKNRVNGLLNTRI